MNVEQFFIKAQKALHILKNDGLKSLIIRLKTKANIGTGRTSNHVGYKPTQAFNEVKPIFVGRILNKEKLKSKMTTALIGSDFRIAFSHDNYLTNVGGLQLKIADEQLKANRSGKGYLHIFPYGAALTLIEFDEDSVIGLNLNGGWVGYTHPQVLKEYLIENSNELNVEGISVHHVMGFDLGFVEKVFEVTRCSKVVFWLHDFFSLCPGYLLLRNDMEFCGAPDVKSNACFLCKYGEKRLKHLQEFEKLFVQNTIEVFSPSEYALHLWREAFPVKDVKATVCPHAILEYRELVADGSMNKPIKIAFVGFPVYHKGWETWLKLTDKFGSDPRYEFFLFSETRRASRNFKNVSVSVTKESRNQMAEVLSDHNIDVAFLWSICPETFSFTLYESLSAGCTILTNRNSGNIQAYLTDHAEDGLVLDSENDLFGLFEGNQLTDCLISNQKSRKKTADIIINQSC